MRNHDQGQPIGGGSDLHGCHESQPAKRLPPILPLQEPGKHALCIEMSPNHAPVIQGVLEQRDQRAQSPPDTSWDRRLQGQYPPNPKNKHAKIPTPGSTASQASNWIFTSCQIR